MDFRAERVTILGVGLIGGSLGMALKQTGFAREIIGVDLNGDIIAEAVKLGAIDQGTTDLCMGVSQADLLVLATPIRAIYKLVPQISRYLKAGAVVTDVSSTKVEVIKLMEEYLPKGTSFVGGHPMAGSEKAGVGASDPYLFENAIYILTPRDALEVFSLVEDMVRSIGAKPLILSPEEHDRIVACVSHLPHLIAATLVAVAMDENKRTGNVLFLAAGGFRDTTRIAGSDPGLWRDIFFSNKAELLSMVDNFQRELEEFRTLLESDSEDELEERLRAIRGVRQEIPSKTKGFFSPIYEIVVMVQDRPGSISRVTSFLAEHELNIKDIEILHLREGEGGTLRLGFASEGHADMAVTLLKEGGIPARRRL